MPLSGLSFAPLARDTAGERPGRPGAAPIQEAIRVLNLRLPSVAGARALAPGPLLHAQGAAGVATGGMNLQRFLEQLVLGRRFERRDPGIVPAGFPETPTSFALGAPSPPLTPRIGIGINPDGTSGGGLGDVAFTNGRTTPVVPYTEPPAPAPVAPPSRFSPQRRT